MTAYAPSLYPSQGSIDPGTQQLSAEEREKLQEIHELINLLLRDLPLRNQHQPTIATLPALPYSYSFLKFP